MTLPAKPFTEALGDLLAEYVDMPVDDMIEVIEIHLEGLRDDARNAASEGESG
jgi:hypothetical protein